MNGKKLEMKHVNGEMGPNWGRPSSTVSPKAAQCARDEQGVPKRMPGFQKGATGKLFDMNKQFYLRSKEKVTKFL